MLRIPKFIVSYFFLFYVATKFDELAPAIEETEEKIETFLALTETERTFKNEQPNFQESSSTTFPMSTGKDPLFIYFTFRILKSWRSYVIFRIQGHSL